MANRVEVVPGRIAVGRDIMLPCAHPAARICARAWMPPSARMSGSQSKRLTEKRGLV